MRKPERDARKVKHGPVRAGYLLIEVLVALAIFGLAATYLVSSSFVAARTIRELKDTRERDQDLRWVRSEILSQPDLEKLEDGDEIETLSLGSVRWDSEVELTNVLDVYKVTLHLEYEGGENPEIEPGELTSTAFVLRPTWAQGSRFASDRTRLLDDKRQKIKQIADDRRSSW